MNLFKTNRAVLLLALIAVSCSPTRGCVESNFELAPESRLPTWLKVPGEVNRADVALELSYYTVGDAVFVARIGGREQQFVGRYSWHPRTRPEMEDVSVPRPPAKYPQWVIVDVDGVVDVIEHREFSQQNRDPIHSLFWLAEDPEVLSEARELVAKQKSR